MYILELGTTSVPKTFVCYVATWEVYSSIFSIIVSAVPCSIAERVPSTKKKRGGQSQVNSVFLRQYNQHGTELMLWPKYKLLTSLGKLIRFSKRWNSVDRARVVHALNTGTGNKSPFVINCG